MRKRIFNNRTDNGYLVALGGSNLDIKGYPDKFFTPGTSNPGRIYSTPGGVARNTAANLAEINARVYLVTSVGQDFSGEMVLKKTGESGVNLEYIIKSSRYQTGTYLAVLDNQGELQAAVADMEIIQEIVPEQLQEISCLFSQAEYIFADTNLEVQTLDWLFTSGFDAPIIVDPVSREKAGKIRDMMGKTAYLTPNLEEYFYLYGLEQELKLERFLKDNTGGISLAAGDAERLKEIIAGSRQRLTPETEVLVSLGSAGVIYSGPGRNFYQPSPKSTGVEVIETTGAGDALTAGFIRGLQLGFQPEKAAALGQQAALLTIQSRETVVADLAGQLAGSQEFESEGL